MMHLLKHSYLWFEGQRLGFENGGKECDEDKEMQKDSIKSVLLVSSSPPEAGRINHRHARDPCVRPGTNTGDALCKVLKGIRNFKWQLLPSLKFLINQNAPIQLIPNHQSF